MVPLRVPNLHLNPVRGFEERIRREIDEFRGDIPEGVAYLSVHILLTAIVGEEKKGLRSIGFQSEAETNPSTDGTDAPGDVEP